MMNNNNFNNRSGGPAYDPLILAGLAVMSGKDQNTALNEGVLINHNMQKAEAMRMEQQRAQMMAQMLPQMLQELQGKSPQEIFYALSRAGIPAENAALIAKNMGTSAPEIKDKVVFNPVTGEEVVRKFQGDSFLGSQINGDGNVATRGNMGATSPLVPGFEAPELSYETPVEARERRKMENDIEKEYSEKATTATQLRPTIASLRDSLSKVETGTLAPIKKYGAKASQGLIGTDFGFNVKHAENIESKAAELVMPLVERNKGAASNTDMKLFLQSVPNLSNTNGGNEMILDAAEALNARHAERYKAMKAYKNKFGTSSGFIQRWDEYAEANPILSEDAKFNVRLNKNHINNWREAVLGEANATPKTPDLSDPKIQRMIAIARGNQ